MDQFSQAVHDLIDEHRRRVGELRAVRRLSKEAWDNEMAWVDEEMDRLLRAREDSE